VSGKPRSQAAGSGPQARRVRHDWRHGGQC
jgi:hypothetical protein